MCVTESRSKIYRVVQYGTKMSKWSLMQLWRVERSAELHPQRIHDSTAGNHNTDADLHKQNGHTSKPIEKPHGVVTAEDDRTTQWRKSVLAALSRVEVLFGDARKVYRLLQFLEMLEMFRNVHEKQPTVRLLRKLRIVCFFLFYVLENSMLVLLRVQGLQPRDPRVKLLKRGLNGFWCLSILLAFPLDHLMGRDGFLSTVKKLLDLPVAYVAFSDKRVSDGIFGALGLGSGTIGIYLRWVEVMAKFRSRASATGDTAQVPFI